MSTPVQTAPKRLTDEQVSELLELEAKATSGEWKYQTRQAGKRPRGRLISPESQGRIEIACLWDYGHNECAPDGNFIAASRNHLRSLLLEIQERRELDRKTVESYMEAVDAIRDNSASQSVGEEK